MAAAGSAADPEQNPAYRLTHSPRSVNCPAFHRIGLLGGAFDLPVLAVAAFGVRVMPTAAPHGASRAQAELGVGRKREDLRPLLRHREGVLPLGGSAAVPGHDRPSVLPLVPGDVAQG